MYWFNYTMLKASLLLMVFISSISCQADKEPILHTIKQIDLTIQEAEQLVELPYQCIQKALPYKPGHTIGAKSDLIMPEIHHPAFYGCFDWHSAVHGHWSIVYILSQHPNISKADELKKMLSENLSEENIAQEIAYFSLNEYTSSFERTYGWAWLLKLTEELYNWEDPLGKQLYNNVQPLANLISQKYIDYLPKLLYPIRTGEHSNTAFGLSFAFDYASVFEDQNLLEAIRKATKRFYEDDKDCPIRWEPSGYDFLSPCLQEVDIMRKVLPNSEFKNWIVQFLPELMSNKSDFIVPAGVIDRSDGKLVHLDGLNFSRAWCLYPIVPYIEDKDPIMALAQSHINKSYDNIFGDHYSGSHWLGTFLLYALKCKSELSEL